jgi:uncharacterized protein (TIGR00251 family)
MHDKGFRLTVRLTPNGGRDDIDGYEVDAAGERYLKARVRAVPEDGKANKALIELIARRFKIAKSAVSILSGETSRKKILRIVGDPEDLNRIAEAL